MTVKRVLLLAVAAALLLASGCGGDEETATEARVYFLRDGKVWPVSREIEESADMTAALVDELVQGPSDEEREAMGLTNEVTENEEADASRGALAQLVYTQSQFDPAAPVEVGGSTYTRADFEDETPSVLVESPLPFEEVETPLRVTGTANTFEANFQYELLDTGGNVVDENFVTATSGTGTRGTFDFTTDAVDDLAALVVFETSAEDGSRMREVEIPLTQAP